MLWEARGQNFGEDGEKEEGKNEEDPSLIFRCIHSSILGGCEHPKDKIYPEPKGFRVDSE